MVTLEPTSALTSVDLPTFGAPIKATKPQRVSLAAPASSWLAPWPVSWLVSSFNSSSFNAAGLHALARQHGLRGSLFGSAFAATLAFGGVQSGHIHRDPEMRIVVRPGASHLAINRCRQAAALRPFLQHRLGIAQ